MGTCPNQWIFGTIFIDFNELAQKLRFPFSGSQDPSYMFITVGPFWVPSPLELQKLHFMWFVFSVSNIPKHLMNYSEAVWALATSWKKGTNPVQFNYVQLVGWT